MTKDDRGLPEAGAENFAMLIKAQTGDGPELYVCVLNSENKYEWVHLGESNRNTEAEKWISKAKRSLEIER